MNGNALPHPPRSEEREAAAGAAEGGGHRLDAEYLTLTLVCFHG